MKNSCKTICIGGKGGVGKTTISAFIIKYLIEKDKKPILCIDADANWNLPELLNIKPQNTIGSLKEELLKELSSLPIGIFKDNYFEYKLNEIVEETADFDLLVMGRPEGPRCYCFANNVLRNYINTLSSNYKYLVIDNEAGLEHISRQRCNNIDIFLIVAEPTKKSVITAGRIKELIKDLKLNVRECHILFNKVRNNTSISSLLNYLPHDDLRLLGKLDYSEEIIEDDWNIYTLSGDNKLYIAFKELISKII